MDSSAPAAQDPPRTDRRARRRQETIEEILDIARDVMTEEGVNGLSLAEVARRLGVQPPSLYKYFPSLMAIYDAIFRRGQMDTSPSCGGEWRGHNPASPRYRRPRGVRALVTGQPRRGRTVVLAAGPELPPVRGGLRSERGDGRPATRCHGGRGGTGQLGPRPTTRTPSTSCRR